MCFQGYYCFLVCYICFCYMCIEWIYINACIYTTYHIIQTLKTDITILKLWGINYTNFLMRYLFFCNMTPCLGLLVCDVLRQPSAVASYSRRMGTSSTSMGRTKKLNFLCSLYHQKWNRNTFLCEVQSYLDQGN